MAGFPSAVLLQYLKIIRPLKRGWIRNPAIAHQALDRSHSGVVIILQPLFQPVSQVTDFIYTFLKQHTA